MRLIFSINAKVLGKTFVIAQWIIDVFVLSSNLSKVIQIICDLITIIHMLLTKPAQYDSYIVDGGSCSVEFSL